MLRMVLPEAYSCLTRVLLPQHRQVLAYREASDHWGSLFQDVEPKTVVVNCCSKKKTAVDICMLIRVSSVFVRYFWPNGFS